MGNPVKQYCVVHVTNIPGPDNYRVTVCDAETDDVLLTMYHVYAKHDDEELREFAARQTGRTCLEVFRSRCRST